MTGGALISAEPGRIYSERIAAARYARGAQTAIPARPLETVIDVTPVQDADWGRGRLRDSGFAAQSMAQDAPATPAAALAVRPYHAALARLGAPECQQFSLTI